MKAIPVLRKELYRLEKKLGNKEDIKNIIWAIKVLEENTIIDPDEPKNNGTGSHFYKR